MLIKMKSVLTGNLNRMRISSISRHQFEHWKIHGGLVERVFPHCTPEQHDFLRSGITPEERDHYNHNNFERLL